jgi:hypothetical protein
VADILSAKADLAELYVDLAAGVVVVGGTPSGTFESRLAFAPVGITRTLSDWAPTLEAGMTAFALPSLSGGNPGSNSVEALLGAAVISAIGVTDYYSASIGSFVDAIDRAFQASANTNQVVIAISQATETVKVMQNSGAVITFSGDTARFTATAPAPADRAWGE